MGVDAKVPVESKAIVIIQGDGVELLKVKVDPQKLIPINVNVRITQKLRIIVTSEDPFNPFNHQATLADARIIQ